MSFEKRNGQERDTLHLGYIFCSYPDISEVLVIYRVVTSLKAKEAQRNFIECPVVRRI